MIEKIIPIIIIIFIFFVLPIIIPNPKKSKEGDIPSSVKRASIFESIFGVLVFLGGVLIVAYNSNSMEKLAGIYSFLFVLGSGMGWFIMATHLNHGSKKARKACLILSILRIPTLIGIIFSIASIYLLYFNKESKAYFDEYA